jgi:predicted ArsR family transcriptional regulator
MTDPTSIHRALADPRRAELVAALEEAVKALDATELGRRVGLHANTVRWHLGILEDVGIVASRPEHRDTPGRPRRVWERAGRAPHDEAGEHRALARALVSVVAGLPEAAAEAEAAGRSWGRLAARPASPAARSEDPVEGLARVLDERGFEPRVDGLEVMMNRCPFADLAPESPAVVCGMHRGLVEGVLAEAGSRLAVDELDVFPRPGVCVLRLREGAGAPDRASGAP